MVEKRRGDLGRLVTVPSRPLIELRPPEPAGKVDWSITRTSKSAAHRSDWGVGAYLSFLLTYDAKALKDRRRRTGRTSEPRNFWQARIARNNIEGMLEAALLADGVGLRQDLPDRCRLVTRPGETAAHDLLDHRRGRASSSSANQEAVMGNL